MLYETIWLVYVLGISIFLSIGLLGLFFSFSIPALKLRAMPIILSLLIILTCIFFSIRWNAEKKRIHVWTQQVEQAITQYLAAHKK